MLSYKPQDFSMPDSLIYLITKNPSNPKFYQKIIKTCKYFFAKNPILVIHCLQFNDNGWQCCSNGKHKKSTDIEWKNINIEKSFSKIWITKELFIWPNDVNKNTIASEFIQRLYHRERSESFISVTFKNQSISFDELSYYSFFEDINIHNVSIKCKNGSEASIESILQVFPKLKNFVYDNVVGAFCANTVENLLQIPHFSNIFCLLLTNIPDSFDINKFYDYLKKNKNMGAIFLFNDIISEEYKNRLKEIINELFEVPTDSDEYIPLAIGYPGNELAKVEHVFDNLIKCLIIQNMLSYKPQDFSLPDSLIYLITKNPSNPEFYQKLIKTCKYFFAKNPILIIHCLQFDDNGWSKCYDCKDEKYSIYESQWETYGDFEKSFSKIWITSQISIRPNDIDKDYIAAGINRRLYQCDTKSSDFLILQNQELVLKELFSYSKFKTVDIKDVSVKCENNLEAPLETIFNIFNKIINFDFTFDDEKKCSTKTVENLLKIPHFSSTYAIILRNIPDSFNIDKFYEFLKKNRNMFVILWFNDTISEEYKNRLKEITNELFEVPADSDKYIPLAIGYPGNELAKVEHVFDNIIKWNENSNVLYELLLQR